MSQLSWDDVKELASWSKTKWISADVETNRRIRALAQRQLPSWTGVTKEQKNWLQKATLVIGRIEVKHRFFSFPWLVLYSPVIHNVCLYLDQDLSSGGSSSDGSEEATDIEVRSLVNNVCPPCSSVVLYLISVMTGA
jgi:hypothetical protein